MDLLKNFILEKIASKELTPERAKDLLKELSEGKDSQHEDIAIIGISGKFPSADNVEEFWNNLKNGVNCVQEWPEERREDFVHVLKNPHYTELLFGESIPVDEVQEGMYVKGGYLREIDKFDYNFFGIPKREARYMDPRQRLILETAWEAMEDAGYGGDSMKGTNTGVFIGKENTNFTLYKFGTDPDPMHLTGGWVSIHASRLSYMYDFTGPCMIVDTACSSGLSSVHVAMKSIKNGECDVAIAGAINTSLNGQFKNHKEIVDLSSVQSKDMLVRTFDKSANGTVWGEGVSMVILKPLKKALEDKDNIHAIIKGSAMNNDGASNGITAPNGIAQEKVLQQAWKDAGVEPDTISYIEAHGTGTVLGDPIEIKGLTNAFDKHTDKKQFCAISSLKTNMGHLVACSGMASLTKVVMSLKNKQIAPTINFEMPNPYINFMNSPLFVNERLSDWNVEDGKPRRAGASSFGFSGTNLHMVFEEFVPGLQIENKAEKPVYCLTISAKKESILQDYITRYNTFFNNPNSATLSDICFTAAIGRGHYNHRLAIIATTLEELKDKVAKIADSDLNKLSVSGAYYGAFKIVKGNKPKLEKWEISAGQKKDKSELAKYKVMELSMSQDNYTQVLKELCVLYVNSADVNWDMLYKDETCQKISLPVYPLERLRCWADPKFTKISSTNIKELSHPLLDSLLADSINSKIYHTTFKVEDKFWMLTDHKIANNPVIPGTTYLEMVHQIGQDIYKTDQLEFKNIFFLTPMLVQEGEEKEVQTVFENLAGGRYKFAVVSKNDDIWVKHVEGEIGIHTDSPAEFNREGILKKTTHIREGEELKVTSDVFQFGPRWNTVRKACHGENDVFITLSLLDEIKDDVKEYYLHPSLLDNAVNILSQSFGEGTYLPLNYKSFKVYKPLPSTLFSYVKKKDTGSSLEVITFDIVLVDENDTVLGEIFDYSIKRVHDTGLTFKNLSGGKQNYNQISWKKEILNEKSNAPKGNYLFITDNSPREQELISKYETAGATVFIALKGDKFEKHSNAKFTIDFSDGSIKNLLTEIKDITFKNVIISNGISQNIELGKCLEGTMNKSLYGLFNLVKGFLDTKIKLNGHVVLWGENVFRTSENDRLKNPFDASMFGLGQVIRQEYQNLSFKSIDADEATTIDTICTEIENSDSPVTTYRANERFVKQLATVQLKSKKELEIKDNGTYVITGGTGGLGLELAKYLADKAKINLVLINRSKLPAKKDWKDYLKTGENQRTQSKIEQLLEIEAMGSMATCYSANVSDFDEMKTVFTDIEKQFGSVQGIIHAAGVAGDGFLMNKTLDIFKDVIKPKIDGTWNLHQLTKDQTLDFFVLFSSITTMTGVPGQSDYTAANAFLNAFSDYREEAVAINWPGWTEVGMAADFDVTDEYTIIHSIKTEEALDYFKSVVESGENTVIPGKINMAFLAKVEDNVDFVLETRLKGKLEKHKRSMTASDSVETKTRSANAEVDIKGKSADELTEVEKNLGMIWSQVLGADEIDIYDSFQEMGGDSILATHLLKAIEGVYPGAIDITDVFSYPTIEQMGAYISEKIGEPVLEEKQEKTKDLEDMLDDMLNDDSSIDSMLEVLNN
ncbi:MAG: hypothetical protein COA88_02415 [Kordia sp.]|nr:MAG: hypothetical protein COA88_02415 [Kordia sp.]